ncbi:MAG: adenylate/guanylate cyclase domain-containing protein, partial [Geminicoccaceae bacterium]
MDVTAWLRGLGLERYEQAFHDNGVDVRVLPDLTGDDLREIGITAVGHRRLLLRAIAALARTPGIAETAGGPSPRDPGPGEGPRDAQRRLAERRQLTVMFVDLVGSTALSAGLDPEDMREVLRAYLDAVADGTARFEGLVARFLGDGVLAYFGWPKAHEDDAERAVRAGLDVLSAVRRLRTPDGVPLAARAGIATGLVVVGDLIGQTAAQEQAVVGDTPNLAARLQTMAEP